MGELEPLLLLVNLGGDERVVRNSLLGGSRNGFELLLDTVRCHRWHNSSQQAHAVVQIPHCHVALLRGSSEALGGLGRLGSGDEAPEPIVELTWTMLGGVFWRILIELLKGSLLERLVQGAGNAAQRESSYSSFAERSPDFGQSGAGASCSVVQASDVMFGQVERFGRVHDGRVFGGGHVVLN